METYIIRAGNGNQGAVTNRLQNEVASGKSVQETRRCVAFRGMNFLFTIMEYHLHTGSVVLSPASDIAQCPPHAQPTVENAQTPSHSQPNHYSIVFLHSSLSNIVHGIHCM
jgi:hypothetical protein